MTEFLILGHALDAITGIVANLAFVYLCWWIYDSLSKVDFVPKGGKD